MKILLLLVAINYPQAWQNVKTATHQGVCLVKTHHKCK